MRPEARTLQLLVFFWATTEARLCQHNDLDRAMAIPDDCTTLMLSAGPYNRRISPEDFSKLVSQLERDNQLSEINLARNFIGDEQTKALAKVLHDSPTLRKLLLSENDIGDEGAKALAATLGHNSGLRYLSLYDNGITEQGAMALMNAIGNNHGLEYLNVHANHVQHISDENAQVLAADLERNTGLSELHLWHKDNRFASEVAKAALDHVIVYAALPKVVRRRAKVDDL